MIARLRRSCLVALCSLPTILPLVAALAAPTALTACGPAEKKTTTPKKPPPATVEPQPPVTKPKPTTKPKPDDDGDVLMTIPSKKGK